MKRILFLFAALLASVSAWAANPSVEMKTSMGTIVIELYPEKAPATVENFLQYARDGFFNGTIFHRVIDGFMIQGGGFTPDMQQKPARPPIKNEAEAAFKAGLKNEPGTIAMARTSNPHSASAQFFINLVDNRNLNWPSFDNWGYAVFGKVTKGFDVVQAIGKVATTGAGGHQNVPQKPVVIESVKIVGAAADAK